MNAGRTRTDAAVRRYLRTGLTILLVIASHACERAGEEQPRVQNPVLGPSRSLPGFVVGQVTTVRGPSAQTPIEGFDNGEVGRRFRVAVRQLPMFADEGGPGPTIDFTLEFSLGLGTATPPPSEGTGTSVLEPDQADYAVLLLSTEGRAAGDPRYQFELHGLYRERVATGERPQQTGERLLDAGIADLVAGLRLEAAPRVANDDDLVDMLSSDDPDTLLPAIREVHRRRLGAAAPALRDKLASDDLEVVIAAATALGRLRDASAVVPLIDLISREHRELIELVLPILGQIGSREARSYLQMLAEGHEHPGIRQLAREVLEGEPVTPP